MKLFITKLVSLALVGAAGIHATELRGSVENAAAQNDPPMESVETVIVSSDDFSSTGDSKNFDTFNKIGDSGASIDSEDFITISEIDRKGKRASIRCIEPTTRLKRGESHSQACKPNAPTNIPYICRDGGKLCCTKSTITSTKLPKYGQCHKVGQPSPDSRGVPKNARATCPNDGIRKCRGIGKKCTARNTLEIMCDAKDGTATSSMTETDISSKREFRNANVCDGACARGQKCRAKWRGSWSCGGTGETMESELTADDENAKLSEIISGGETAIDEADKSSSTGDSNDLDTINEIGDSGASSDSEDFITFSEVDRKGKRASIRCIEPTIRLRRGESHSQACKPNAPTNVAYICRDGGKLCCTKSSITSAKLPKYGQCHKVGQPGPNSEKIGEDHIILGA